MMFLLYLTLINLSPFIAGIAILFSVLYAFKHSKRHMADKKAQVILLSHNIQEVKNYLNYHITELSDSTVKQLITHLESLQVDDLLDEDLILKRRFDTLSSVEEVEETEEEIIMKSKKVTM